MQSDILNFWFEEISPKQWWEKNDSFDKLIRDRFLDLYHQAIAGELWQWRKTAEGCLAEIIILDQFSRNIFRDKPQSFAADPMSLVLAQAAVASGANNDLPVTQQKAFIYMPYMHSESSLIHAEAVRLFSEPGMEFNLDFEMQHKAIIDRFGRYPHRNKILGRESTPDELEYLRLGFDRGQVGTRSQH